MLPSWIHDRISVRWFAEERWETVELEEREDWLEGFTSGGDCVTLRVEMDRDRLLQDGQTVYRVNAEVSAAGVDATVSGLRLEMAADPALGCVWKPHLAPEHGMTIGDKAFRSPVIVLEGDTTLAALIPDLHHLSDNRKLPHVMDYFKEEHRLYYGLCAYEETGHVYYRLTPHAVAFDRLEMQFFLVEWTKSGAEERRDFRRIEHFLWERFASGRMALRETPEQIVSSLKVYQDYAYGWAFDRWKDVCWHEFTLDGKEVGGVVFIVTAKQKPGLGREEEWREPKSIWNQAWFCSLRTSYGYGWEGKRRGLRDWVDKADKSLAFALSAPQTNGLFPGYYEAGEDHSWASGRWYMSGPRRPDGLEDFVHLADSSWTCYWMLKWYRDLKPDPHILVYVRPYVSRLLTLQRPDGGFPAWVHPETMEVSPYLAESPETSVHAMLFCLLQEIESSPILVAAAEKAAGHVLETVVAKGKWEDFETYWSCSNQWEQKKYGIRDKRSGLYNQCSLGIYWTAESLIALFRVTGDEKWLAAGEQVLAEASLYQQIWEPDYIAVPSLGGFGVMTSDDEWNDARQSLFALTYYEYYRSTGNDSYLARSMWALKASFYMMYCPENPQVKALYETVHPHFDRRDYGFHMENFNHHDGTQVSGLGEFTIFDWGCGAAAASLAELGAKIQSPPEKKG